MTTSIDETCLLEKEAEVAPWGRLRAVGQQGLALVDQAVVSGASFMTTLVVGRVAGREQLGAYSLGFTLVVLALCLQDALVASPYTVYANRLEEGEDRSRLTGAALAQLGLLGLLLGVALALAAWFVREPWPLVSPVLGVLALTVPWVLLREFRRRLAYAHQHNREALVIDGSAALLQLGGLVGLMAAGVLSAATAHAAVGLAAAVVALTALALAWRHFSFRREHLAGQMRRHWDFGRWLLAGQLTGLGYWHLVQWLLAARLGTAATGAFAACLTVVTLANPFILGFGLVLGPSVARAFTEGGPARVRHILVRSSLILAGVTLLLAGLAALVGGYLIAWLYGPDYAGHGGTVALLSLVVPLVGLNLAADHGLRAVERPQVNFKASLASLVVTVAVTWILLGWCGLTGAALSLFAGEATGFVIRWSAFWCLTRDGAEGRS